MAYSYRQASSKGGVTTQDKMLDTVEIIRKKYQYRGYVHLKVMPGAEQDQVYRAMQLGGSSVDQSGRAYRRTAGGIGP